MPLRAFVAAVVLTVLGLMAGGAHAAGAAPRWESLKPAEREVLAPLKDDWETLDAQRKRKWIAVAKRYPAMKPDEQARLSERMRMWASLTPDQRRGAREMFLRQSAMPTEKRDALPRKWEEYQQAARPERSGQAPVDGAIVPTAAAARD
jgi:hypothetical protein